MVHEHDNPVCYHQPCPVCGRNLRIGVMLLGQRVYCQHCGGGFVATDGCDSSPSLCTTPDRSRSNIVDELIERASVMLGVTSGVTSGITSGHDEPSQAVRDARNVLGHGVE